MTLQLSYKPNSAGIDTGRYELSHHNFRDDQVATWSLDEIAYFLTSDHWEDRIRAELLRQHRRVTLPDQFPCIYETEDSPNQQRSSAHFRLHAWVKSSDISLLHAVLDCYQELWDCYTSQWGGRRSPHLRGRAPRRSRPARCLPARRNAGTGHRLDDADAPRHVPPSIRTTQEDAPEPRQAADGQERIEVMCGFRCGSVPVTFKGRTRERPQRARQEEHRRGRRVDGRS